MERGSFCVLLLNKMIILVLSFFFFCFSDAQIYKTMLIKVCGQTSFIFQPSCLPNYSYTTLARERLPMIFPSVRSDTDSLNKTTVECLNGNSLKGSNQKRQPKKKKKIDDYSSYQDVKNKPLLQKTEVQFLKKACQGFPLVRHNM